MRTVSLEELQALLGRTPAMVQMHPLSLAFLPDEVLAFETAEEIIAALDSPEPQPEVPMVALMVDEQFAHNPLRPRPFHDRTEPHFAGETGLGEAMGALPVAIARSHQQAGGKRLRRADNSGWAWAFGLETMCSR